MLIIVSHINWSWIIKTAIVGWHANAGADWKHCICLKIMLQYDLIIVDNSKMANDLEVLIISMNSALNFT